MIVLDTNVLSGLMRQVPEPVVTAWLDLQPSESIWITTITMFETRMGLALLPGGQRRKTLESSFSRLVDELLDGRVLDFDRAAADAAAAIAARRSRAGRPVDVRDTQIAGIVQARRATLATRNVKHFSDLSIEVVNPWNAPA